MYSFAIVKDENNGQGLHCMSRVFWEKRDFSLESQQAVIEFNLCNLTQRIIIDF